MSILSQAELEVQYQERQAQVQSGKLSPEQAFSTMEDWVIQLGQRKALLHPGLKQWLWYDWLHNSWVTAGCGIGQAILLSIGKVAGLKKLPQTEDVAGWCVYRQGQELFGPVRNEELLNRLNSQPELKNITVWSPRATTWLSVAYWTEGAISLFDEAGNRISISIKGEAPPAPTPVAIPSAVDATLASPRKGPVDIFCLTIMLGDRRFPMGTQLRLGRDTDNDLALPDEKVSPHHAIIQRQGVVYKIADLNSESGTYVNGNRINGPTLLKCGDVILIGDTRLTISDKS